jgi:hypothetical protein
MWFKVRKNSYTRETMGEKKLHLPTEDSWWTSGGEVGEGAGHHAVDQHHEKVALLPQLSFAKLSCWIHTTWPAHSRFRFYITT